MIKNKMLISIIPVRKNSKGIKNKNLLKINNLSLLERTILISKNSKFIDKTFVTTDCMQMQKTAQKHNVSLMGLRPKKLSTESALTIDVVKYVIKKTKLKDVYILLLQVTSPFRTIKLTNVFLNKFNKNKRASSSVSVSFFDNPHPCKAQKIENGWIKSFLGFESMVPRQSLPKVLSLNGLFYIANSKQILKNKTFFSKYTLPFIVNNDYKLNLDTPNDLVLLRNQLKYKKILLDKF